LLRQLDYTFNFFKVLVKKIVMKNSIKFDFAFLSSDGAFGCKTNAVLQQPKLEREDEQAAGKSHFENYPK
jgi:hypothetical protein